jgi:hypothetical protein
MQHVCYVCTCWTFLGFLVNKFERYSQNKRDRLNEYYIINDGSPVISRNTWSMYAR